MYRDDQCAVCGESLPPDHLYCREHAATVDERLHELGELLARVTADVPSLVELLGQVAQETYDWLAESRPGEPDWPPAVPLALRLDPDQVAVDVDSEPGYVRVRVLAGLRELAAGLAEALDAADAAGFAAACAEAEGANATH